MTETEYQARINHPNVRVLPNFMDAEDDGGDR